MAVKYDQKLQQHAACINRLQEAASQVKLTVIVVSHSGVATSTLQTCLQDWGVPQRQIDTVITNLAHNALRAARIIRRTRAVLCNRAQQQPQPHVQIPLETIGNAAHPPPQQSHRPTSIRRIHDPGWPTKQIKEGVRAWRLFG
jgi:hypothetical protein